MTEFDRWVVVRAVVVRAVTGQYVYSPAPYVGGDGVWSTPKKNDKVYLSRRKFQLQVAGLRRRGW